MNQALIEAVKEFGRISLLAVLPVLIAALESAVVDWRAVAVTAVVALLKALDKYIHERKDLKATGLVPF